jgi:hypothetical protein
MGFILCDWFIGVIDLVHALAAPRRSGTGSIVAAFLSQAVIR